MLAIITLAALAAPLPTQSGCLFLPEIEVRGTITTVLAPAAPPLDSITPGDSVLVTLGLGGDVVCQITPSLVGQLAAPSCCSLAVGGTEVGMDPAVPTPCIWNETSGAPRIYAELDAAFNSNDVRFRMEIEDPLGDVGIGSWDIIKNGLDVASVTAPGFTISASLLDPSGALLATVDVTTLSGTPPVLGGIDYCQANPNSTGAVSSLGYQGSLLAQENNLALYGFDLPLDTFSFFIVSMAQGFIPNPGGSAGNLCVEGAVGRFVGPGQIQNSGSEGFISIPIDLSAIPQPNGSQATLPGDTWNFQVWHRDVTPQGSSNFSRGMSVTFQ